MTRSQTKAAELSAKLRARNPLIIVRTREEHRVEPWLFEAAAKAGYIPRTWDVASGIRNMDGTPLYPNIEQQSQTRTIDGTLDIIANLARDMAADDGHDRADEWNRDPADDAEHEADDCRGAGFSSRRVHIVLQLSVISFQLTAGNVATSQLPTSFPRKRGSQQRSWSSMSLFPNCTHARSKWIPAFAGMTRLFSVDATSSVDATFSVQAPRTQT